MRFSSALLVAALLLSCASGPSLRDAERDVDSGNIDQGIEKLEQIAVAHPNDYDVYMELTEAYFKKARKALDEGDQAGYLRYLGKAQESVLRAAELNPDSPSPHTWMGIIAAYQSDLDRVLINMKNARRLDPRNPIAYSNLAETYIYMGKLSNARRNLKKARKLGAPPVIIEMNEVLAAWRTGDYVEARDLFDTAYGLDPQVVRVWNEAAVSEPIQSFEDFTRFCCDHVACGPYMADACQDMNHGVRERNVDAETVRQELVLEMERRRRLEKIYGSRRDLDIEVESPQ